MEISENSCNSWLKKSQQAHKLVKTSSTNRQTGYTLLYI